MVSENRETTNGFMYMVQADNVVLPCCLLCSNLLLLQKKCKTHELIFSLCNINVTEKWFLVETVETYTKTRKPIITMKGIL